MKSLMKFSTASKFFVFLIVFIFSIYSFKAVHAAIVSITAEKTVVLQDDQDKNGIASPGDILEYTITILNQGNGNATGVVYNDTLDVNTTLVPDSLTHSPIAVPDEFPQTVIGNVRIDSSRINYSVLENDHLGHPAVTEISLVSPTSTQGGNVTMVTSGENMGQFTYDPPPGYEGFDTFSYRLTNSVGSSTATVKVKIEKMIWFVNNTAETCTTLTEGCGRLTKPFSTLASFAAFNNGSGNNPADNDVIFVYASNTKYTGSISLLTGQKLIGQNSSEKLSDLISVVPGTSSDPLPIMNSGIPNTILSNTITINSKSLVQGLRIEINNNTGMNDPASEISDVKISEVSVSSTSGRAVDFSNINNGTINFKTIEAWNGTHGIVINGFTGNFTVSDGTISNTSSDGIKLNNAKNITLSNININNAAQYSTNSLCNLISISTGCEAAIEIFNSEQITLNNILINQNTMGMQGIVIGNSEKITITKSQILNVGNTDNESGMLLHNLTGLAIFEDLTISSPQEFGIRIYQTTGTFDGVFRRVKIQNNNGTFGEDGLSIRVEGGTSTILVENSDFLNTGGSGVAASVQGSGAILNLTVKNSRWTENHQLPHAVSFTTAGAGKGNITIQNNTMYGCEVPSNCFGAIDLDASDSSTLEAFINGNSLSNISDGTGIEFIVNDFATGKAIISNNSLGMQPNRIGMNFLARSVNPLNSNGSLHLTITGNTINGISSNPEGIIPGMNFQSGSSTGTHAQTLCVNLATPAGGNIINGSNTYAYLLRQRTGTKFQLQGLTGDGTNESIVEDFVKNNNTGGTLAGITDVFPTGGTTIVNYSAGICLQPDTTPTPTEGMDLGQKLVILDENSEKLDDVHQIEDFNKNPFLDLKNQEDEEETDHPSSLFSLLSSSGDPLPSITLGVIPPGGVVTIKYQVSINNPLSPITASQVVNQGIVSGINFSNVLTDDPAVYGSSDPTIMLLPKPDLIAVKTNNVNWSVTFPTTWRWNIRLQNIGNYQAEFSSEDTLLTDELPDEGLTYSNLTVLPENMNEKLDCSIVDNILKCKALTDLVIDKSDYFDVSFNVTPNRVGLFTNPINSGICKADPNIKLIELNFDNNSCNNTVSVNSAPKITSANTIDFIYNASNTFTIQTTAGYPIDTFISLSGSLPNGVIFTNLGNGIATLSGTPTTSGSYNLTIKAFNLAGLEDTQNFTLVVNQAPEFTSDTSITFTTGTLETFTISSTGYPTALITFTSEPDLPDSILLTDNKDGTATLSGTPVMGDGGVYSINLTANNGISPDATQTLILTINQPPSITSTASTIFLAGQQETFTFSSSGYPIPSLSYTGSLPSGVSFVDNEDGSASLSGISAVGSGGEYIIVIAAGNGVLPNATQDFSLTVNEAPSFTSGTSSSFTSGVEGSFVVTTTGFPTSAITFTSNPSLPTNLTFHDNSNGTATLSGKPETGEGGVYTLSLTAKNGVNPDATQTLVVTIGDGPIITSMSNATFIVGVLTSFNFTSSGYPVPIFSYTGDLPSGVSFVDNKDGTASLSGMPDAGSGGQYSLEVIASNGILPDAKQNFNLTVNEPPEFTNESAVSFTTSEEGFFTISTSGYPTSTITFTSNPPLPASLTLTDNEDGTATLKGTPATGDGGVYTLSLTANNGVSPNATQSLILTIGQAPTITSADNVTFEVGSSGTFTITASGYPYSLFSYSGSLPTGVIFTDNLDGTASLSGTPANSTGGEYSLAITANNGISPNDDQSFTLIVNEAPEFTSANKINFSVGTSGEFTIETDGYPIASITHTSVPDLPASILLIDNKDGTATISGIPVMGDGNVYTINLIANNGIDPVGMQSFTLTIGESPQITSIDHVTFVEGNEGTFIITTSGTPTPDITFRGDLPEGITIIDQNDGTALLSGTPSINTANTYPLILEASNGVGDVGTQVFYFIVQSQTKILAINSDEDSGDGKLDEFEHTNAAITKLFVTFSEAIDTKSANDIANYKLEMDGKTISIESVQYDETEKIVTLEINGGLALSDGQYQFTVSENLLDKYGYPMSEKFVRIFIVDTISIEVIPFGFSMIDSTILKEGIKLTRTIQSILVTFDEDASNPPGNTELDDVTNPSNYLLVSAGLNGKFDTISCKTGMQGDDILFPVGPIVYDNNDGNGPFKASVTLNNGKPLPNNLYRFFVCGSTSVTDLAGNKLNNGNDLYLTFSIQVLSAIETLPSTGFAPGRLTDLHLQPHNKLYQSLGDLWLEIPSQNINAVITGVPWIAQEWDLSWLNNQVGWLEGTAFPTWNGNSVLTAHAYRPNGLPGPFAYLKSLKFGDTIIIHYQGLRYYYVVQSLNYVSPNNISLLAKLETHDWLTLITCQQFDEKTQTYLYRTIVRAVLIKVDSE